MFKIAQLRAKRKEVVGEIRSLLDLADAEKRDLTVEENAKKDSLYASIENIDKRIADEEKLVELAKADMTEDELRASNVRVIRDERDDEIGTPRNMFSSFGEQLLAVRAASLPNGSVDKRLLPTSRAATGSNEAVGADGGFLVQKDFAAGLMQRAVDAGQLSSRVDSMPVNGNGLVVNEYVD